MTALYAITAGLMFGLALYGLLSRTGLIQRLLAANLLATGVFLFLVVLSVRAGDRIDPVPQAMVLTGIVITVSVTAFAIALVRWFRATSHASSLEELARRTEDDRGNDA